MKGYGISATVLAVSVALLSLTCPAFGGTIDRPDAITLLLEARTAAASVKEPIERSYALESIILSQIYLDPSGARESLKMFPDMSNKSNHLVSLASVYAKAGNIKDTEEIYAEIKKGDSSNRQVKLASANALGHIAVAYANAGTLKKAFQILAQLKEQFKGEPLAIFSETTARIAEAQAKLGDVAGAVETVKSIAGDNPYPLMSIISGRVRANDLPGAVKMASSLEDRLQQYAKWGIVIAQGELDDLKGAQATASTIKPGHAKAYALLELATRYIKKGDRSTALLLLQEGTTAAASTVNGLARADILWRLAATMSNAGNTNRALEIAKSIETDAHRRFAINDIVKAQAEQGNFKEAFDTALLLKNVSEADDYGTDAYAQAIAEILAQLTKLGRAKEALEAVLRFDNLKPQHQSLYGTIAAVQADTGDIQGARATLSYAETEKQRIKRRKEMSHLVSIMKQGEDSKELQQLRVLQRTEDETHEALEAIALAYARQGSFAEASKVATDFDFHYREDLFKKIGKIAAEGGQETRAIIWARTLTSPSDKVYALLGINWTLSVSENKPTLKQ